MRVNIKSNFVFPGLENKENLDLDRPTLTLREFLEELSMMAPIRIEYVRPGTKTLAPDEWEVDINDIPYQQYSEGLETFLKDGDTVTIRISALGGG